MPVSRERPPGGHRRTDWCPSLRSVTASASPAKGGAGPEKSLSLNGPDTLAAYKHSWNPMTAGPDLVSYADTLPEGVFNVRFFFYIRFT